MVELLRAWPVPNLAGDKVHDFAINARWYRHVVSLAANREMIAVGIAHTHTPLGSATPTDADYRGLPDGAIGLLYLPHKRKLLIYGKEDRNVSET